MRNIILAISILFSLGAFAQRESKVSDSTRFTKGVRFDSTLVFKRLKAAAAKDTVLVIMDANGTVSKINKSNLLSGISGGGTQTLSISGDTLSISEGNSVVLPVYVQADSSTISSYDVLNSQNTPPVSPNTGDVYLVGTVPSGVWAGHAKDIAEWNGSSWVFTDGLQGDFLYNATTALTYIFRSGNWVQTTGVPALNNGNTISSGLRIGTNNARSLTFETNNVNRGRFDSIGRFYIYNLPISTDTFVNVVDENGKFGKVGKSSIVDTTVISTKDNVTSLLLPKANQSALNDSVTTLRNIRKVDSSYLFKNATRDSICMVTVINGISYRSCGKDSVGSGTAYTFSTGLTNTSSTITNNLSTGVSGGQSVIGGTASGENLTLSSTSNATKGDLRFGTSVYKEVNNRLGIGTSTPAASLDILGSGDFWGLNVRNSSVGALFQVSGGKAGFVGFSGSAYNNLDIRCGVPTQLFLSTNGNVGIGNSNPSQKLSLTGALSFSGLSAPSEGMAIYAPEISTLSFMTNSVERIRINNIGNVGIGTTTPVASAKLEVSSTTSGFLPPRMTATQASAISTPAQGLLLFVTDTNGTFTSVGWWGYNGSTWEKLNN